MSMNVGLNFSQHGHRTSSTQCNSFTSKSGISAFLLTMHSTDSHTDIYIQTIFIRSCVCVYILAHI